MMCQIVDRKNSTHSHSSFVMVNDKKSSLFKIEGRRVSNSKNKYQTRRNQIIPNKIK